MNEPLEILLVDDDEVDRLAVRRALQKAGLKASITEAPDAPEALALLRERAFDCALLDLRLPRSDGLSLLREARAAGVETPVVMLTGHGDEETAVELMKAGAADYIPKAALSPERLGQSVRHAVRVGHAERGTARAQHALEQHARRLRGLAESSLAISAAASLDEALQSTSDLARSLIGAHLAITSLIDGEGWARAHSAVSLSSRYEGYKGYVSPRDGSGIYAWVCSEGRPVRMAQAELEAHPHFRGFGREAKAHPPLRGWLAAPLIGRDGKPLGIVQLSDRDAGEFTEEDESLLAQLAQSAAIAIENRRLVELATREQKRAEDANRAKDEFLAVISHELRTPLNAILGWTRMLRGERRLPPERQRRALEAVERNARAQARLVEDLLDISRVISGKLHIDPRPIDLRRVLEAAVLAIGPAAEAKHITLTTSIAGDLGKARGDGGRLQQVTSNLLVNAIKFTKEGGKVALRAGAQGGWIKIEVEDSGQGIDPAFMPHIFDRFRQADSSSTRAHGGLGLGLSIARSIVELHGGKIHAASPGKGLGATFTVELPEGIDAEEREAQEEPREREAPGLSGVRVLLVDDDEDGREVMQELLGHLGADIRAFGSAAEAITALDALVPDVLVSDIGMPGQDGYALINAVRARPPGKGGLVPAIALTAYAGVDDRARSHAAGFQVHVSKPVEPMELVTAIAKLTRGG